MLVVFFIFLVYKIINAQNSETKLIDLLPDEEKEVFLDKIARRILADAQLKPTKLRGSGEVSEAQLDENDEYVRNIMKEETENLKVTEEHDNVDKDASSNDKPDVRAGNDKSHVDLTLRTTRRKRQNNRKVFTGYASDEENDSENANKNNEESDMDIQVKNVDHKSKNTIQKISPNNEALPVLEDDTTAQIEKIEDVIQPPIENSNPESTQTDKGDERKNISLQIGDDIQVNAQTESVVKETKPTSQAVLINTEHEINKEADSSKEIINNTNFPPVTEEFVQYFHNTSEDINSKSVDLNNTGNVISRVTRSYDKNAEFEKLNKLVEINHSLMKNTNNLEDSKVINIEISPITSETVQEISTTGASVITENDTNTKEIDKKTGLNRNNDIETTSLKIEVLSTTAAAIRNVDVDAIKNLINAGIETAKKEIKPDINEVQSSKDIDKDQTTHDLVDGLIKVLKQNLLEKTRVQKKGDAKDRLIPLLNTNGKEYKVYEVPAGVSPFVKQNSPKTVISKSNQQPERVPDKMTEQPYLVPVYKFSPKNAFYNPKNVYGLNIDSNEKDRTNDNSQISMSSSDESDIYDADSASNKFDSDYYNQLRKGKITKASKTKPEDQLNPTSIDSYATSKDDSDGEKGSVKVPFERAGRSDSSEVYIKVDPKSKNSTFPSMRHIRQMLLSEKYFSFFVTHRPPSTKDFSSRSVEDMFSSSSEELRILSRSKNLARNHNLAVASIDRDKDFKMSVNPNPNIPMEFYHIHNKVQKPVVRAKTVVLPPKRLGKNSTIRDRVTQILQIVPAVDAVPLLVQIKNKLQDKKSPSKKVSRMRDDIEAYVTVMGDMIEENNKALVQYSWLETAVELQSAIKKMSDMIAAVRSNEDIHPSDLELLKFLLKVHSTAAEDVIQTSTRSPLPRNKKKKKGKFIQEKGLIHRVWLARIYTPDSKEAIFRDMELFEEFIEDLQTALFDLHSAIKYISMVTKYNKQKWFENLKQIYLENNRKQIMEVLLHMITSRTLSLVEEAAKNGLEDDYISYATANEKEVSVIQQEFRVMLNILYELKIYF